MNKLRVLLAACILGCCAAASAVLAAPPSIQPRSWTLAILPDTQFYAKSYPDIFNAQMQFLADNKMSLNVAYVLHEGDITHNNVPGQWANASKAFQILEDADLPYSLVPGNHDYGLNGKASDRTTDMADYFTVSRLAAQPTFGGAYPGEPDSPHNSYSLFSAGGTDWLVLALEFGPRDEIIAWADGLLKKYSNRSAMIVTHAYLDDDGKRLTSSSRGHGPYHYGLKNEPGGVNDGGEMWTQLKDNPNLQFIFCGHIIWGDGVGYLASKGDCGNVVHQILANYQHPLNPSGGNGYLRLLEFLPDGKTVHVHTYSPYLDSSLTTPEQDFVITMTRAPEPSLLPLTAGQQRKHHRRQSAAPQRFRIVKVFARHGRSAGRSFRSVVVHRNARVVLKPRQSQPVVFQALQDLAARARRRGRWHGRNFCPKRRIFRRRKWPCMPP